MHFLSYSTSQIFLGPSSLYDLKLTSVCGCDCCETSSNVVVECHYSNHVTLSQPRTVLVPCRTSHSVSLKHPLSRQIQEKGQRQHINEVKGQLKEQRSLATLHEVICIIWQNSVFDSTFGCIWFQFLPPGGRPDDVRSFRCDQPHSHLESKEGF